MSPDIGTYFILRVNQPEIDGELGKILTTLRPIGVHFGADAFLKDADYSVWFKAYQELRKKILKLTNRPKMIWAIDHEGGRVNRLPNPITRFPYPMNWQDQSGKVGSIIGKELHSLGINLLFGPSLDILSEQSNQVIGPRAFGKTPEEVIRYILPYIKAVQNQGVTCCGKHFPGHGGVVKDSHFELPELDLTLEEITARELQPFLEAFKVKELTVVMLAHLFCPKIDKEFPASLSQIFTQDILNRQLNFSGITITDDLDMKAINDNFSDHVIAKAVLNSKLDLLIFNHNPEKALRIASLLNLNFEKNKEIVIQHQNKLFNFVNTLKHDQPTLLPEAEISAHQVLLKQITEKYTPKIKEFTGD